MKLREVLQFYYDESNGKSNKPIEVIYSETPNFNEDMLNMSTDEIWEVVEKLKELRFIRLVTPEYFADDCPFVSLTSLGKIEVEEGYPNLESEYSSILKHPPEIKEALKEFWIDSPYEKNVFVMMRYRSQDYFKEIEKTICDTLYIYDLEAKFAKEKAYEITLWDNIRVYMHGCKYGIVIFEEIDEREYNPNVSFELGYMHLQGKRCLLLKEHRMPKLPTDVCGHLYKDFDQMNIEDTIMTQIKEWIEKDLGLLKKSEINERIEILVDYLNENNEVIRIEAVKELLNIGNKDVVIPLTKALKDENVEVRINAIRALERIGSEIAIDALSEIINDPHTSVRLFLARALGGIGGERVIEPLIKLIKDDKFLIRIEAVCALENQSSGEVIDSLIEALNDDISDVRGWTAYVLGEINDNKALPHLMKLKDDSEPVLDHDNTVSEIVKEAILKIRTGRTNKIKR